MVLNYKTNVKYQRFVWKYNQNCLKWCSWKYYF